MFSDGQDEFVNLPTISLELVIFRLNVIMLRSGKCMLSTIKIQEDV
jgi:hypothetical protein